jgi:hypothetical protein
MNWNTWVRRAHRWLSMAFTAGVLAVFAALGAGREPPEWAYLLPLPPLALLLLSGLYLFALPHAARWRARRGAQVHRPAG